MALVTIRAVTTFLTPEQYGALALLIAVQTFCGFFLVNPVGQHINLHTHAWWDDGTLMARLKSYRRYIFAVSLVGCVVVIGMGRHLSVEQVLWSAVAMFVMVARATSTAFQNVAAKQYHPDPYAQSNSPAPNQFLRSV